jgi:hypothetical protein
LQNKSTRFILNSTFDTPSKQIFKTFLISIKNRIQYHEGGWCIDVPINLPRNTYAIILTSSMQSTSYSLRSSNISNLFVPRPNSNVMKRALHYSGIILWHRYPLKRVKNVEIFKKKYSDYLLLQQEHD